MALSPLDVVLNAYADAYPEPNNLKVTIESKEAKYYPADTYNVDSINEDFVENSDKQGEIVKLIRSDENCGEKTVAFVPQEGTGSWGYFKAKDVEPYVTDDETENVIIINFSAIQKLPRELREIFFHRALTMIYGEKHPDTNNYFFDPQDHIKNAAGLKGTVDIMIKRKVVAA